MVSYVTTLKLMFKFEARLIVKNDFHIFSYLYGKIHRRYKGGKLRHDPVALNNSPS